MLFIYQANQEMGVPEMDLLLWSKNCRWNRVKMKKHAKNGQNHFLAITWDKLWHLWHFFAFCWALFSELAAFVKKKQHLQSTKKERLKSRNVTNGIIYHIYYYVLSQQCFPLYERGAQEDDLLSYIMAQKIFLKFLPILTIFTPFHLLFWLQSKWLF